MKNLNHKDKYRLYIDELGTASPADYYSKLYILSGCSVRKSDCSSIKIYADQIKFKYWGHTNVVFHSREIGRLENDFEIFKNNEQKFKEFIEDLKNFLNISKFKMFFIVVDKKKARQAGWDVIKIHKDTTTFLVRNFLLILLTNDVSGEIIIESASAQKDIHLLEAFNYFLGAGIPSLNIDYKLTQDTLTSVAFVTKKNHDIEEQIADLFAYGAKLKYEINCGKKIKKGLYEHMILSLFNNKIFSISDKTNFEKKRLYKDVEPFLCIP